MILISHGALGFQLDQGVWTGEKKCNSFASGQARLLGLCNCKEERTTVSANMRIQAEESDNNSQHFELVINIRAVNESIIDNNITLNLVQLITHFKTPEE